MDIYTNVYPQVKLMVRDFKPDHDYNHRKIHALIVCVAAYFVNVQNAATQNTTLVFNLQRFYKHFAQKRELLISIVDLQQQVDDIKTRAFLQSSVILREPAKEYQFLRIASKPYLNIFIERIGTRSVEDVYNYILKHSLHQKLNSRDGRLDINDLYTILISEVLHEKKLALPQLGNSAGESLRDFLYSKSVTYL